MKSALGKSVEEVESEQGNRVNSSVSGEELRQASEEVAVIPAVSNSNLNTNPGVLNPDAIRNDALSGSVGRGGETADQRSTDSSETSEG